MAIKESGEMYLETILILSKESPAVRSIDVAAHLDYSKPSVSRAIGILKSDGYIKVDSSGNITLTDEGKVIATSMYERHQLLSEFLVDIGVPEDIATEDACRMEHVISNETFQKIKDNMKK